MLFPETHEYLHNIPCFIQRCELNFNSVNVTLPNVRYQKACFRKRREWKWSIQTHDRIKNSPKPLSGTSRAFQAHKRIQNGTVQLFNQLKLDPALKRTKKKKKQPASQPAYSRTVRTFGGHSPPRWCKSALQSPWQHRPSSRRERRQIHPAPRGIGDANKIAPNRGGGRGHKVEKVIAKN